MSEQEVKKLLEKAIKASADDGFSTFITGMARGIDIWAAQIVLNLKSQNADISLICAPPYEGFEKKWEISEQKLYHHILESADDVKFICKHYSRSCFQIRNCYMVDNSNRIIAFYNGEKGGTKNTIDYAVRRGVEVINVLKN